MSKIVNSSVGNDYFQINGSAISNTAQPKLDGGAIAGLATSAIEGEYDGYEPSVSNPDTYVQNSGVDNSRLSNYNVTNIKPSETKINEVYKVRTYLISSAIRNNKLNTSTNTFDTNYPATGEVTSEIQVNGATNPTLSDDAIGVYDEVVYNYVLAAPTQADI